jgi:hypothetical protein
LSKPDFPTEGKHRRKGHTVKKIRGLAKSKQVGIANEETAAKRRLLTERMKRNLTPP